MIFVNKIRCNKCGDIIESISVHDFKFCKCGAVAVDGGHDYNLNLIKIWFMINTKLIVQRSYRILFDVQENFNQEQIDRIY